MGGVVGGGGVEGAEWPVQTFYQTKDDSILQ